MAVEAGRVALVTGVGAPGGIGFAVVRALVAGGARVAVTFTTARCRDRAAETGAFAQVADLTDPAQAAALFAAALGPVEVLVNNAGMVQTGKAQGPAPLAACNDAACNDAACNDTAWAQHLALNINTTFPCCRAALPGWIATDSATEAERRAGRQTPVGRPGTAEEVAACAVFPAFAGASHVMGAMLVVDGGNTLQEVKG